MVWDNERRSKLERMDAVKQYTDGKVAATESIVPFLEGVIRPGDRVATRSRPPSWPGPWPRWTRGRSTA